MFIFVHSQKGGKLIALEDLKEQKRAQRGLVATTLKQDEKLKGVLSIDDGAITLRYKDGTLGKIHSNDVKLKNRYTPLDKIFEKFHNKEYNKTLVIAHRETQNKTYPNLNQIFAILIYYQN